MSPVFSVSGFSSVVRKERHLALAGTCPCLMTLVSLPRTSLVFATPPQMLRVGGVPLLLLGLGYILIKQMAILLLRGLPFS